MSWSTTRNLSAPQIVMDSDREVSPGLKSRRDWARGFDCMLLLEDTYSPIRVEIHVHITGLPTPEIVCQQNAVLGKHCS